MTAAAALKRERRKNRARSRKDDAEGEEEEVCYFTVLATLRFLRPRFATEPRSMGSTKRKSDIVSSLPASPKHQLTYYDPVDSSTFRPARSRKDDFSPCISSSSGISSI